MSNFTISVNSTGQLITLLLDENFSDIDTSATASDDDNSHVETSSNDGVSTVGNNSNETNNESSEQKASQFSCTASLATNSLAQLLQRNCKYVCEDNQYATTDWLFPESSNKVYWKGRDSSMDHAPTFDKKCRYRRKWRLCLHRLEVSLHHTFHCSCVMWCKPTIIVHQLIKNARSWRLQIEPRLPESSNKRCQQVGGLFYKL